MIGISVSPSSGAPPLPVTVLCSYLQDGNAISGRSLTLLVNGSQVDSATTDFMGNADFSYTLQSDGQYTFLVEDPLTMVGSNAFVVNVVSGGAGTLSKFVLTSPLGPSPQQVTAGTSVTFDVQGVDQYGNPVAVAGQPVYAFSNGAITNSGNAVATTNSSGSAVFTLTFDVDGSYSITVSNTTSGA